MTDLELTDRAADLRRAFDRSFAEAPVQGLEALEALVGLRVAGTSYAIRLREIASLLVDRRIVRLPSSAPSLLGVSGIRGTVAPVYSLRTILGHASSSESPRWLVLAQAAHVGFAFEEFDGYLRVPRAEIVQSAAGVGHAHVSEVARTHEAVRPIVSLSSVIDSLRQEKR